MCPICGNFEQAGMMCGKCARQTVNDLEMISAGLSELPDMPFSNMQRQVEKMIDTVDAFTLELSAYARKRSTD